MGWEWSEMNLQHNLDLDKFEGHKKECPKQNHQTLIHKLQHRSIVFRGGSCPHQTSLQLVMWLDSQLESMKMIWTREHWYSHFTGRWYWSGINSRGIYHWWRNVVIPWRGKGVWEKIWVAPFLFCFFLCCYAKEIFYTHSHTSNMSIS